MPTPSRQGNAASTTPRVQYIQVERPQRQGFLRKSQRTTTTDTAGGITHRITSEPTQVSIPNYLPRFLGNRIILVAGWAISMIAVGVDDWKNNGIFPRPQRLWSVSLFYGLLALASLIDSLVPIINALAIGYTIMLLWQYFQKSGQFA